MKNLKVNDTVYVRRNDKVVEGEVIQITDDKIIVNGINTTNQFGGQSGFFGHIEVDKKDNNIIYTSLKAAMKSLTAPKFKKKDLKLNDVVKINVASGNAVYNWVGIITSLDYDGKDSLGIAIPSTSMGQYNYSISDAITVPSRPFSISEITDVIDYKTDDISRFMDMPDLSDFDAACTVVFATINGIAIDDSESGIGDRHYEPTLKDMINWRYEDSDETPYDLMQKNIADENVFLHLVDNGGYIYFYSICNI